MARATAVVLCSIALAALTACGATKPQVTRTTDTRWSGYVLAGHYTQVSADWVQPALVCSAAGVSHSSFWVGLDEWQTVEQTGIEADCFHGTPIYRAWYELVPKEETYVPYRSVVKPGDKISASVTSDGNGHFTLTLADPSENWIKSTRATLANAKLESAEVIVENAPNIQGNTLANFGTVSFTHATANGASFSDLDGPERINMVHHRLQAATSPISHGAFSVTWKHS